MLGTTIGAIKGDTRSLDYSTYMRGPYVGGQYRYTSIHGGIFKVWA